MVSSLSMRAASPDSEGSTEYHSQHEFKKVSETTSCTDVPVLRRATMDYLARREHSFFELKRKLQKKFPDTDLELLIQVIDALRAENLQSDERFAESYVRYRKSKGFAYLHIRADLASRQVSESVIQSYLDAEEEHWQLTANQLVEKRLRAVNELVYGSKLHKKTSRFLESRGFTPVQIRKALEKHIQ